MQLRHNNTFSTVDDEGTLRCHIRYHAQIDMLFLCYEIFILGIFAAQLHLGLQWHTICKATLNALLYAVTRRIDVIIQEFKFKIISRISDGEILFKDLEQPFIEAVVRVGLYLEKVFERLYLNVEKIRVIKFAYRREIYYCGVFLCQGTEMINLFLLLIAV